MNQKLAMRLLQQMGYQADLAKIGVTLNIRTMDPAAWANSVLGNSYNGMYATGDANAHLSPVADMPL